MSREITELISKALETNQELIMAVGEPEKLKKAMINHSTALANLNLAVQRIESDRDRYLMFVRDSNRATENLLNPPCRHTIDCVCVQCEERRAKLTT